MRRGNLQGDAFAPVARPRVRRQRARMHLNAGDSRALVHLNVGEGSRARVHLNADEGRRLRRAHNCGHACVGRTAVGVHGLCARRTPARTYIEVVPRPERERPSRRTPARALRGLIVNGQRRTNEVSMECRLADRPAGRMGGGRPFGGQARRPHGGTKATWRIGARRTNGREAGISPSENNSKPNRRLQIANFKPHTLNHKLLTIDSKP